VQEAWQEVEQALPFRLLGVDSDHGSEFINWHLKAWCEGKGIQRTRGRAYKKDDNAHREQKNWTQVRKLLGWDGYDSPQALEALNDL
jgi:transposase InsO family protein